jgi:hypothetical protein
LHPFGLIPTLLDGELATAARPAWAAAIGNLGS